MIILLFFVETICCDPHLNCLDETVQMRGHNIWFYAELTKIIPKYHQILPLISSSGVIIIAHVHAYALPFSECDGSVLRISMGKRDNILEINFRIVLYKKM